MNDTKKVNKTVWKSWEVAYAATAVSPVIRRDDEGDLWAWVTASSIKVTIRKIVNLPKAEGRAA